MSSPKLFCLLSPKSPAFEIMPSGIPEITWEMICSAKARMKPETVTYAEFAWEAVQENKRAYRGAKDRLLGQLNYQIELLVEKHWRNTSIEDRDFYCPRLARLLVKEIETNNGRCKSCEGVGERLISNTMKTCPSCNGWGKNINQRSAKSR